MAGEGVGGALTGQGIHSLPVSAHDQAQDAALSLGGQARQAGEA